MHLRLFACTDKSNAFDTDKIKLNVNLSNYGVLTEGKYDVIVKVTGQGKSPFEKTVTVEIDPEKTVQEIFEGEIELVAVNKADTIYKPYEPEITENERKVLGTANYLPNAKSVIVLGLRMPHGSVDITARTPAEAAGPYVFAQYETIMLSVCSPGM